jgi:hypothetical protein
MSLRSEHSVVVWLHGDSSVQIKDRKHTPKKLGTQQTLPEKEPKSGNVPLRFRNVFPASFACLVLMTMHCKYRSIVNQADKQQWQDRNLGGGGSQTEQLPR